MIVKYGKNETKTVKIDAQEVGNPKCPRAPPQCSVSDEIDQKTKVDQNDWFFLKFFPPAHFNHWKLRQTTYATGDHGDHGTSVSDEIDQK